MSTDMKYLQSQIMHISSMHPSVRRISNLRKHSLIRYLPLHLVYSCQHPLSNLQEFTNFSNQKKHSKKHLLPFPYHSTLAAEPLELTSFHSDMRRNAFVAIEVGPNHSKSTSRCLKYVIWNKINNMIYIVCISVYVYIIRIYIYIHTYQFISRFSMAKLDALISFSSNKMFQGFTRNVGRFEHENLLLTFPLPPLLLPLWSVTVMWFHETLGFL